MTVMMNKLTALSGKLKKLQLLAGFIIVLLTAFAFRNFIAERDLKQLESATGARFAPFMVESAIMYGYINKAAAGQAIAGIDPALPAMSSHPVAEQMSILLEYPAGWLLQLRRVFAPPHSSEYEVSYAESRFIRRCFSWHIALAPALIFWMLRLMKVPFFLALLGSAVEIFSAAALGRYTGQDLIRGAFAWPVLASYLTSYAALLHCRKKYRPWAKISVLLTAFAATACWDGSTIFIALLAGCDIVCSFISAAGNRRRQDFYLLTFTALILSSLSIPYLRGHGFFFSPVVQFAVPGAFITAVLTQKYPRYYALCALFGLAVWSTIAVVFSPFSSNYSHFAELMIAKLKFFNQLPADPALLNFTQRYL